MMPSDTPGRWDDAPDPAEASPVPDADAVPFDATVLQQVAHGDGIAPRDLPELLGRVDGHLIESRASLQRRFESPYSDDRRELFFVPPDYWDGVASVLSLSDGEKRAVQQAHERQLLRIGAETRRGSEFDAALDIRTAVVVSRE
ncbi:hypothetical protein SY89_00210 [Halolamina pelagica]|uniref:DUF8048 domain-containing protein n=1 Tax=Halolamina pelagica TaxID=699431 RepID=A0A0P7GLJ6_9EURY|nr:hypothetical protein [Halolamina pelagica]KPN29497.1 hypothetical protein SY89_00210 [Halolamina pelagica]